MSFFFILILIMNHSVIDWIESNVKFGASAGPELYQKNYKLIPWQTDAIQEMYSTDGEIKKRNLFLIGARKTGKSDFAKLISLWRFFESGCGEVSSVSATSFDQAGIIFESFAESIKLNPRLSKKSDFKKLVITNKENGNTFHRLSTSAGQLGKYFNGIQVFDELGVFEGKHFRQIDVIQTSQALAKNYQNIYLANVPETQTHRSIDVLRACERDPDWQTVKFVAPERYKNIGNERAWEKANPFLQLNKKNPKRFGHVREYYKKFYKKARGNTEQQALFERLLLGRGCELRHSNFITVSDLQIEQNPQDIYRDDSIVWAIGIDLSVTRDSTSWSLVGVEKCREGIDDPLEDTDRRVYVYPRIYYPSLVGKTETYKEKILEWHRQGFVTLQSAGSTEMRPIVQDVFQFLKNKPVVKSEMQFVFDPSFAASWYEAFSEYPVTKIFYMPKQMTSAVRMMQRKAMQKNVYLLCGDNPAVKFQAECGLVNNKSRGWCLLDRQTKESQNIDAWVASLLGLSKILLDEGHRAESFVF